MSTTLNLVWRILLILAAVALLGLAFLRIPLASRWFPIASTSLLAVPLTVIAVGEGRRHVAVALGVVVLAGLGADLVSRAVRARGLPFPLRGRPSPSRRGLIASLAVAVAVLVPIGIVFAHDRPKGQDLLAQSDLQTVVSAIEACHSGPPAATYDRCAGLLHPKNVQLGPGRPAVQVTAAASRYVVVARSGSGNDFVFDKTGGKHCTVAGRALCPAGGNW